MRVQAHLPGQLPDSVTACCRSVPSCTSILFAPLLKVPQPWWCAHQTAQLPITARPPPNDFSRRINTPCYHQRPANSSRTRSVETEETNTTNTVLRNSSSVFLVQNETMLASPHPQAATARHTLVSSGRHASKSRQKATRGRPFSSPRSAVNTLQRQQV